MTASYWGISETVIHFVIYESLKKELARYQNKRKGQEKTFIDFAGFMLCGACSKTCATCIAYPHGKSFPFNLKQVCYVIGIFYSCHSININSNSVFIYFQRLLEHVYVKTERDINHSGRH